MPNDVLDPHVEDCRLDLKQIYILVIGTYVPDTITSNDIQYYSFKAVPFKPFILIQVIVTFLVSDKITLQKSRTNSAILSKFTPNIHLRPIFVFAQFVWHWLLLHSLWNGLKMFRVFFYFYYFLRNASKFYGLILLRRKLWGNFKNTKKNDKKNVSTVIFTYIYKNQIVCTLKMAWFSSWI